jgi:hypothetical protein
MEALIVEIVCSQKRCRICSQSAHPLIGFDKAVLKGPSTKDQLAEILEMERNMEATNMPLPE